MGYGLPIQKHWKFRNGFSRKINSEIVSLINKEGGNAVGLSGKDGLLILEPLLKVKNINP